MKVTFTINFATELYRPRGNVRDRHWSTAHKRTAGQRSFARNHLLAFGKQVPKLPATVRMTLVGAKPVDRDNLHASLKAFRDEVAAYLKHQGAFGNWWEEVPHGAGDSDDDPVTWEYEQEKGPRGRHALRIEIEGS